MAMSGISGSGIPGSDDAAPERLAPGAAAPDGGQLPFSEDDTRLPWLESDDDEDDYEPAGSGQIIAFVLVGLVALALLVGGIWWLTHRDADGALPADGSTIEAPAEPYKVAPADPGGKTFDGTGDSSFAVSAGQTRPARLGQDIVVDREAVEGPQPVAPSAAASARPATAAATPAPRPTPQPSGIGVQVGAYSSAASAEAAWTRLSQQYTPLSGLHHRVVEGRADIGTVYRLQALAGNLAAAQALCGNLKAAGLACQVKQ